MTNLATLTALLLTAASATAFSTPRPGAAAVRQRASPRPSSTSLHLFGSKPKDPNAPQQPGMMDQLAMFKKAQEIAQKKAAIDKELAQEDIAGTAADGKITVAISYVPPQMPARPTPGYEATGVEIDAEYLAGVDPADLSAALVEAVRDGEKTAAALVGEKYQALGEEMKSMMAGQGGDAPPEEQN